MSDEDSDLCTCGDVRDEHGHDPEFPGSTACAIEGCECVAFEKADQGDDDDDEDDDEDEDDEEDEEGL